MTFNALPLEVVHTGDKLRVRPGEMLTGDGRTAAETVAKELDIDNVGAEVLAEPKVEVVKRLKAEGRIVAMAGYGIAFVYIAAAAMSLSSASVIVNSLRLRQSEL